MTEKCEGQKRTNANAEQDGQKQYRFRREKGEPETRLAHEPSEPDELDKPDAYGSLRIFKFLNSMPA